MNEVDINRVERESARWHILVALNAARPIGASEVILKNAIVPIVALTALQLRREMDYLESRGLVEIERGEAWRAKLTRDGIDVVEYTVPVDPGIARPAKYW